jgi:hypothetical protein
MGLTRASDDAKRSFGEERRTIPASDDAKRSFGVGVPRAAQRRGGERRTIPASDDDAGGAEIEEWRR